MQIFIYELMFALLFSASIAKAKESSFRLMRVVGQTSLFTELEKRIPDVRVHPDGSIYILTDSENENGKVLCITPIKNG